MIDYRKNQPKSIQQRTKSHRDLLSQLQRILFRLYFLVIDSIIPFFQIHNTVIICGLESDLVVRNRYFLITMYIIKLPAITHGHPISQQISTVCLQCSQ